VGRKGKKVIHEYMETFPNTITLTIRHCCSKFSCTKYEQSSSSDLSSEVVQKSSDDCKMLGPVTAGFNGAACDIFHGTWCPTPRDCSALVQCIANAAAKVQFSTDRKAFFEYLNGAPKVKPVEVRQ
jgi:hypothetical protein